MLNFFTTDVGKVALGGAIAVSGQIAVTLLGWAKDSWFAADKNANRLSISQFASIQDRGLFFGVDLPLVVDFASVEAVAQQIE